MPLLGDGVDFDLCRCTTEVDHCAMVVLEGCRNSAYPYGPRRSARHRLPQGNGLLAAALLIRLCSRRSQSQEFRKQIIGLSEVVKHDDPKPLPMELGQQID